jgi:hypothetical protein
MYTVILSQKIMIFTSIEQFTYIFNIIHIENKSIIN